MELIMAIATWALVGLSGLLIIGTILTMIILCVAHFVSPRNWGKPPKNKRPPWEDPNAKPWAWDDWG